MIVGSNLSQISKVSFEGTEVDELTVDVDGTFIEFQTPGGELGSVAIVVIDKSGQKFDTDLEFTYDKQGETKTS